MPTHSRSNGARAEGRSKPFRSAISLRATAWSAAAASAFCLAMLAPSLASSPLSERERAALPSAGQQRELVPLTRFAAVPSDSLGNAAVPSLPVPPPALTPGNEPDLAKPEAKMLPPKVKGAFPRGLHPVIKHSMVEASRYLPEGWQLEFMNALRDAPGVWNGPHGKRDKTGGALAVDVWLVNPKGERLCNFQCRQNFEPYQTFMQMVKHIQDRDFPAYRNQGRWGGYFGGSYANDEMHYDLEPSDWTMAGNWKQGLLPGYAYFGKKGDTLKGMGDIAAYRLPDVGLGAIALAKAPPVDLMVPLAVPQRTAAVQPVASVKAKWSKPRAVAQRHAQVRPARQFRRARVIREDYDD